MLREMLRKLWGLQSNDELLDAARRETQKLEAELERMDIRIEMATHRTAEELERDLRRIRVQVP